MKRGRAAPSPPRSGRAAGVCLFVLLLAAPFEPRLTLPLGPFGLSLLEAIALPCFLVLLATLPSPRSSAFRAAPIAALALMFGVSLVSAALADPDPPRAFKFALRIGAMALFAFLVSRRSDRELRWGLWGLALSGTCAALLAINEGLGVRGLDPLLDLFRETPFNVAGVRRATAGSEYPNLGGAMIVYALLAGVTLLKAQPGLRILFVVGLTLGLAFTFSRGAWLAGLTGLAFLAAVERGRGRALPLLACATTLAFFVRGEEVSQIRFQGESANDFYAATYRAPRYLAMDAGAQTRVSVAVTNSGRRPWRTADQFHLSYHLYADSTRPLLDGSRTDLPRDVLPGETVTVEATVLSPLDEGDYVLMWDLVHEDTTWFSGQGVRPAVARLTVGTTPSSGRLVAEREAILALPEMLAFRPTRLALWRAAASMWAANPFFGVGPDNFRWTYGHESGRSAFDTRVFANNMFLEFAATLGTLGLAAFGAALALALAGGWTQSPRSEVALAATAILVAMTVHGLVDYVLAFTGHYLVFGFAVGAVSPVAPSREPG